MNDVKAPERIHMDDESIGGLTMSTDLITAARTMIEPLTGYTPKPWKQGQNNPDRVSKGGEYIANCNPTHQSHPRTENNARLTAAAPDMRDMVAFLADALEAERAKVAAAYEAAAQAVRAVLTNSPTGEWGAEGISMSRAIERAIHALTPNDAQAALDKLLDNARLEGWRAGREAAAIAARGDGEGEWFNPVQAIRALPEPREAGND